jgi:hypothetical protein
LCSLKAILGLFSAFEITVLINSSVVRLNRIGLIGQPCLTPALVLMGDVSSSRDVWITVEALVYVLN